LIHDLLLDVGGVVKMKDPTRGGLANALNEWSSKSNVGILINETKIPMRESVKAASEMLGIDPLEVANEGKIILSVVSQKVEEVLTFLKDSKKGRNAEVIGDVTNDFSRVVLETEVGGKRILSPPVGDPIPRIC
jgi:hydrogenase expression/formation protein HypE